MPLLSISTAAPFPSSRQKALRMTPHPDCRRPDWHIAEVVRQAAIWNVEELDSAVVPWQSGQNERYCCTNWRFTTSDARPSSTGPTHVTDNYR
jgi:hypothetical protein